MDEDDYPALDNEEWLQGLGRKELDYVWIESDLPDDIGRSEGRYYEQYVEEYDPEDNWVDLDYRGQECLLLLEAKSIDSYLHYLPRDLIQYVIRPYVEDFHVWQHTSPGNNLTLLSNGQVIRRFAYEPSSFQIGAIKINLSSYDAYLFLHGEYPNHLILLQGNILRVVSLETEQLVGQCIFDQTVYFHSVEGTQLYLTYWTWAYQVCLQTFTVTELPQPPQVPPLIKRLSGSTGSVASLWQVYRILDHRMEFHCEHGDCFLRIYGPNGQLKHVLRHWALLPEMTLQLDLSRRLIFYHHRHPTIWRANQDLFS